MKLPLTLFLPILLSTPAALAESTVTPAGMQIVWQQLDKEFDGFSTLNSQDALTLSLYLKSDTPAISLEKDDITLTSLTDSTGKEMKADVGFMPKLSEDGKSARFEINSKDLPAAGDSSVTAKGTINFLSASKSEKVKSKTIELKKDQAISWGDKLTATVTESKKNQWGDHAWEVSIKFDRKVPELADIIFYDKDGTVIESKRNGTMTSGFLGKTSVTYTYSIAKKVDSAVLEATIWLDAKKVSIPFTVTTGK